MSWEIYRIYQKDVVVEYKNVNDTEQPTIFCNMCPFYFMLNSEDSRAKFNLLPQYYYKQNITK